MRRTTDDWRTIIVLASGIGCTALQALASRGIVAVPALPLPAPPTFVVAYLVVPMLLSLAIGENPLRFVVPRRPRPVRTLVPAVVALVAAASCVAVLERWSPFAGRPVLARPADVVQLVVTLFCVEFFFRGFLVLPLVARLGWWAVAYAAAPYVASHVGKPAWEVAGALPFALVLGALVVRTRSILYGLAVHVAVAVAGSLLASR